MMMGMIMRGMGGIGSRGKIRDGEEGGEEGGEESSVGVEV
jgi:hypothetical protein